ncbi:Aldehyde dehydrogenase [Mycena kentingensis (nom. inval.)]|nr:Aldehyde dehydrogenase [Mycena kentingensis (nom. inval.)]
MKRGFLKSAKATERSLGPSLTTTAAPAATLAAATRPEVMRAPFGKLSEEVEVPNDAPKFDLREVKPGEDVPEDCLIRFTRIPPYEENVEPTAECIFNRGVKEMLYKIPNFPHPLPPQPYTEPAFRVAQFPGRGLGLFSTRTLKQGDAILVERPLLVTPAAYPAKYPSHYTMAQYVQHMLNEFERGVERTMEKMEPKHKEAFMALHNSHTEDGSGPLVGRVRTNGIGLQELSPDNTGVTSMHTAICEFISRLNHSCSPNTSPYFDKASFSFTLYAVRDIAEGEEFTFQYTDVTKSTIQRNEALRPYGFQCVCRACTDPATDARRALVGTFTPMVAAWVKNRTLPDNWFIDKCTELIELLETEGLEYVEYYYMAVSGIMQSYVALGDAKRASEWAKRVKAITWAPAFLVEAYGHNEGALDALLDPKSKAYQRHGLWRARR